MLNMTIMWASFLPLFKDLCKNSIDEIMYYALFARKRYKIKPLYNVWMEDQIGYGLDITAGVKMESKLR